MEKELSPEVIALRKGCSQNMREWLLSNKEKFLQIGSSLYSDNFADVDLLVAEREIPAYLQSEYYATYDKTLRLLHLGDMSYADPMVIFEIENYEHVETCPFGSVFSKGKPLQFIIVSGNKFQSYTHANAQSLKFFQWCRNIGADEDVERMQNDKSFRVGVFRAYAAQYSM